MNSEEIIEKIIRNIKKSSGKKPEKYNKLVRILIELECEGQKAYYSDVIKRLWPNKWEIAKDKDKFIEYRRGNLHKLRRKINDRLFDSDACFNLFIDYDEKKLYPIIDPQEIYNIHAKSIVQRWKKLPSEQKEEKEKELTKNLYQKYEEFDKRNAVIEFLKDIEDRFKEMKLFHKPKKVILKDLYVRIHVTLERKYLHEVETSWGYTEDEIELTKAYSFKDYGEKELPDQVPWEELKENYKRIMVLADPGLGKSTLMAMEAWKAAKQEKEALLENERDINEVKFPIVLKLFDIDEKINTDQNRKKKNVSEAIFELVEDEYIKMRKSCNDFIKEKIVNGQYNLLLDALDEVPIERRIELSKKLNRFARHFDGDIICTSRIVGYEGAFLDEAKEVEIVPFRPEQVKQYVNAFPFSDNSVSANGFVRELQDKPQVKGLAQNPFLLSLLCSLYNEKDTPFPARKVQIYKDALNHILSKWSKRKQKTRWYIRFKIRLLEELAYDFSLENKEVFLESELSEWFIDYLNKKDTPKTISELTESYLLQELSEDDGIIIKLDEREEIRYIFLHRTFQEYLTASYLNRAVERNQNYGLYLAGEHFRDFEWHETLTLLAGLLKDPIPLLQAILNEEDDIFSTLLILASRCLAECQDIPQFMISDLAEKIYDLWLCYPNEGFVTSSLVLIGRKYSQVCQWLENALQIRNKSLRFGAVDVLARICTDDAVEPLIKALRDGDRFAMRGLKNIGSEKVVYRMIDLLKEKNNKIREYAMEVLAQIDNEIPVMPLIEALKDKHILISWWAVEALGKIESEHAVEQLIECLKNQDEYIQGKAAEVLRKISKREVMRPLIEAMEDDNYIVRTCAAEMLGKVNSEVAVNILIKALDDKDMYVRRVAVSALGETKNQRALNSLIITLKDDDPVMREYTAEALGNIGGKEAVEPLIRALKDKVPQVREMAVLALGKIGDEEVINPLAKVIENNSEDETIRKCAAEVLTDNFGKESIPVMIRALRDKNRVIRKLAAELLGEIQAFEAVKPLIKLFKKNNEHFDVKLVAAEALGKIGNEETIKPLLQGLNDEYLEIDLNNILDKIVSENSAQFLIKVLKDSKAEENIRASAARLLGKIRNKNSVRELINIVNDENENDDLRTESISALGWIGAENAVGLFTQILKDNENRGFNFRYCAAIALRDIGNEKAVEALIQIIKDSNEDEIIRSIAAQVLDKIDNLDVIKALLKNPPISGISTKDIIHRLEKIHSPKAVNCLIQILFRNDDDYARAEAAEALGNIGGEKALNALTRALRVDGITSTVLKKHGTLRTLRWIIRFCGDNIYCPHLFSLMRTIWLRHRKQAKAIFPEQIEQLV